MERLTSVHWVQDHFVTNNNLQSHIKHTLCYIQAAKEGMQDKDLTYSRIRTTMTQQFVGNQRPEDALHHRHHQIPFI